MAWERFNDSADDARRRFPDSEVSDEVLVTGHSSANVDKRQSVQAVNVFLVSRSKKSNTAI